MRAWGINALDTLFVATGPADGPASPARLFVPATAATPFRGARLLALLTLAALPAALLAALALLLTALALLLATTLSALPLPTLALTTTVAGRSALLVLLARGLGGLGGLGISWGRLVLAGAPPTLEDLLLPQLVDWTLRALLATALARAVGVLGMATTLMGGRLPVLPSFATLAATLLALTALLAALAALPATLALLTATAITALAMLLVTG